MLGELLEGKLHEQFLWGGTGNGPSRKVRHRASSSPDIVIGEARYALSPDGLESEFALSVADDWRGMGLGTLLIADIECRVRTLGARHLSGEVLRSNQLMKALAQKNGFLTADVPRDARLVRIVKDLALSRAAEPCEALTASDLATAA